MAERVECRGRRVTFVSEIERLPNGVSIKVDRVIFPNAAAVLPLDTRKCTIRLIRQYRPSIDKWILEAPAGVIDPGEEPGRAAERELEEETGLRGSTLVKVAEGYVSPGYSTEYMHLYLAINPVEGRARPERHELIDALIEMTIEEALEKAKRGEINDVKTLLAIYAARDYCKGGQILTGQI